MDHSYLALQVDLQDLNTITPKIMNCCQLQAFQFNSKIILYYFYFKQHWMTLDFVMMESMLFFLMLFM